jgi:hypothetical protein
MNPFCDSNAMLGQETAAQEAPHPHKVQVAQEPQSAEADSERCQEQPMKMLKCELELTAQMGDPRYQTNPAANVIGPKV